jgi:citrate synthase
MVNTIGDRSKVEAWVENALSEKQKIMGMGHRVYKVIDPRAIIMERFLVELSERKSDSRHHGILKAIQTKVTAAMESAGKSIYPNVDFFSGAVYLLLGIPPILFTPIFAMARVPGWLAHILEQRVDNRLFRPKSLYVGPEPQAFIPAEKRQ